MEKNKSTKTVGKGKILTARLLLVILIVLALGITYLKFFGPNENLEEHPVKEENKVSPVIIEVLQTIVNNFNNSSLVAEYRTKNIIMKASLTNTTIQVEYISDITKKYEFSFESPNLIIDVDNNDIEDFSKVYKIIIYANQERLGITGNFDNYINGFLNDNLEVNKLSKTVNGDITNFVIDISSGIGDTGNTDSNQNNDQSTTTDDTPDNTTDDAVDDNTDDITADETDDTIDDIDTQEGVE